MPLQTNCRNAPFSAGALLQKATFASFNCWSLDRASDKWLGSTFSGTKVCIMMADGWKRGGGAGKEGGALKNLTIAFADSCAAS